MTATELPIDFSIAICAHNPDARLFARVLAAVEALQIPTGTRIECVIVDNCSDRPLAELPCVAGLLQRCDWARVVPEARRGLAYARIGAIEATTAPILCFIDDDNEPAPDYLVVASRIMAECRWIAALGPGKVVVDYVDTVSAWFAQRFSHHFQQKDYPNFAYGSVPATWTEYYPPGSCMVIRREVLDRYCREFLSGSLSAIDRVGTSLSSGGDTQIVWEAIKMGLAAGISPELKIKHMIPAKRTSLEYIKRLCYGTSSSYLPALAGSFPSEKDKLWRVVPSNGRIVRDVTTIIARHVLRLNFRVLPIALATYFGTLVGTLRASGFQGRNWIYKCVDVLKLIN